MAPTEVHQKIEVPAVARGLEVEAVSGAELVTLSQKMILDLEFAACA